MGKKQSIRSKAVHFVSDLTTVILNPISDKPSKPSPPKSPLSEDESEPKRSQQAESNKSNGEEKSEDLVDGPDTSSFTAFLYSFLASSESGDNPNPDEQIKEKEEMGNQPSSSSSSSSSAAKENGAKKGLLSKGKQKLSRVVYQAARFSGYRNNERKSDSEFKIIEENVVRVEKIEDSGASTGVPEVSEPSLLLSANTRHALYASLPALVQGRQWILLYSTWRHGISLSTLYRRSMLWPGLSLLVVGDRKGATFGGLIEAPLNPTNKKKYQGSNETFVFTDRPGHPVIFRPTGANRYFTLCSLDFLAIGGGGHFALYLDHDLLNGSSAVSETYGNPCLANSEEFEVKEVELWGFVYPSKYEEILALSRIEAPGICRW